MLRKTVLPRDIYNATQRSTTFQSAMKWSIIIGQCFGLNPVIGVFDIDASKMRFKSKFWNDPRNIHHMKEVIERYERSKVLSTVVGKLLALSLLNLLALTFYSARYWYTIFSIFGQGTMLCFCIVKFLKDTDTSLSSNTSLAFYSSNFMTTVLFLRMAKKWPRLCLQIAMTEASSPNIDTSLVKKCNVTCILILALALVEHLLSDISGWAAVIDCQPQNNVYEAFVKHSFPWVFVFVPYNHFIGFLSQFINIQSTFTWSFADLFIICISFYLTSRLEQVNNKIVAARGKIMSQHFWRTVREDYTKAVSLVRRVDDVIGAIIFISFANNLFFICLQLYNTLKDGIKATPLCHDEDIRPLQGYEQATYFMYSFIFLVMRSLAVSLIAARVYTSSRKPAISLYEVSSNAYCIEIQRFIDQIHKETVALSGLQFFNIRKGLVLSIAGKIVTYELVLLQFTGMTPTSSLTPAEGNM